MTTNSKHFEPLVLRVASGMSIRDAAAAVGCSESRAYHLSQLQEFKLRVADVRTKATDEAVGKLSAAAAKAVATLESLLDESQDPKDRLNAAKAILAALLPLQNHSDVLQRVRELERKTFTELKVRS
jgi:hypothetical protein